MLRYGGFLSHRATPKSSIYRWLFPFQTIQLLGYPIKYGHIKYLDGLNMMEIWMVPFVDRFSIVNHPNIFGGCGHCGPTEENKLVERHRLQSECLQLQEEFNGRELGASLSYGLPGLVNANKKRWKDPPCY